jgi:hypothetical protein
MFGRMPRTQRRVQITGKMRVGACHESAITVAFGHYRIVLPDRQTVLRPGSKACLDEWLSAAKIEDGIGVPLRLSNRKGVGIGHH